MFYAFHNVDVNKSVSDTVTKDNNTVNVNTILYYKYSSKNRSLQINIDCIIFSNCSNIIYSLMYILYNNYIGK